MGANGSIYSVAIQPNGKVIVAGSFTSIGGSPRSRIARLLSNGSLDSSFGAGTDSTVLALTLQTDGKVVLGGQFTSVNAASNIRLARLLLTDASVSPVITNLVVTGGNTTLNWISSANKIYRVDYTPLVYPANWTSLVPNVTATGNSASFTNNAPGTLQRFYRVALLPF